VDHEAIRPFFETNPHPNVHLPLEHAQKKRFVALYDGDKIIGAATMQNRGLGVVQVGGIYVAQSLRGKGRGQFLLNGVKREARADGGRWLVLGAYRREPDVSPFYRRVGFRAVVPYIPGAKSPFPGGLLARGLAKVARVEAGPDSIRLMACKA
jgi:GNAT superfamily N-acetyltransferase